MKNAKNALQGKSRELSKEIELDLSRGAGGASVSAKKKELAENLDKENLLENCVGETAKKAVGQASNNGDKHVDETDDSAENSSKEVAAEADSKDKSMQAESEKEDASRPRKRIDILI